MMNKKNVWVLAILLFLFAAGCKDSQTQEEAMYQSITAAEAKIIMDEQSDYIILDVRTDSEYAEGHIEGAVLIPDYEIQKRAEKELPDKDKLILIYCRSGRRSAAAAEEMVAMGYTNVIDFGGIIDWPYEITTGM